MSRCGSHWGNFRYLCSTSPIARREITSWISPTQAFIDSVSSSKNRLRSAKRGGWITWSRGNAIRNGSPFNQGAYCAVAKSFGKSRKTTQPKSPNPTKSGYSDHFFGWLYQCGKIDVIQFHHASQCLCSGSAFCHPRSHIKTFANSRCWYGHSRGYRWFCSPTPPWFSVCF